MKVATRSKPRQPDFEWNGWCIELMPGAGMRELRGSMVEMALLLQSGRARNAAVVLTAPKITQERMNEELELFRNLLWPHIGQRVHLFRMEEGRLIPPAPQPGLELALQDFLRDGANTADRRGHGPARSQDAVLAHLVRCLLDRQPAGNRTRIARAVGVSAPTVAAALAPLEHERMLDATAEGEVMLRAPSWNHWRSWMYRLHSARKAVPLYDHSRMARTPRQMADRLTKLDPPGVAIGGVLGALHHVPSLDITGGHVRLDLTVRNLNDRNWLPAVQGGLSLQGEPGQQPTLVLHQALGETGWERQGPDGTRWASPLECILDLGEMGFGGLADSMYHHYLTEANTT